MHSTDKIYVIRTQCKESFNFTISPTAINSTMLKCELCCVHVCDFERQFFICEWKKHNRKENTIWHFGNDIYTFNRPVRMVLSSFGSHTDFISSYFSLSLKSDENEIYRKQQKEPVIYVCLSVVGSLAYIFELD